MSGLEKPKCTPKKCHRPDCKGDAFAALSEDAYKFCEKENTLVEGIEQGKKL
jgi:hypothetical protein